MGLARGGINAALYLATRGSAAAADEPLGLGLAGLLEDTVACEVRPLAPPRMRSRVDMFACPPGLALLLRPAARCLPAGFRLVSGPRLWGYCCGMLPAGF